MPSEATPAERQLVSPPGSRNVLIRRRSNYRSAMSITGPVDNDHVHALLARLKANFNLDVATRRNDREPPIVVTTQGTGNSLPITGRMIGGGVRSLRNREKPRAIDLQNCQWEEAYLTGPHAAAVSRPASCGSLPNGSGRLFPSRVIAKQDKTNHISSFALTRQRGSTDPYGRSALSNRSC
jgi:hypothetical protein